LKGRGKKVGERTGGREKGEGKWKGIASLMMADLSRGQKEGEREPISYLKEECSKQRE
jgi:hypothetical protein